MRQSVSTNLCGFVTYQCIKRTKNAKRFRKIHRNNNLDKKHRNDNLKYIDTQIHNESMIYLNDLEK